MRNRKIEFLGFNIDNYSFPGLISQLQKDIGGDSAQTIFSINPEKIIRASKDPALFSALEDADYLIPDGIGVVLGIRILCGKKVHRISGIDLLDRLLQVAHENQYRVYLFGARPEVNSRAAAEITRRFPSLKLVGKSHGYLEERSYESLVRSINSLATDFLFVGMGSPKQEKWIHYHKESLKVKICMGIGGSLDVMASQVQRAPQSLQRWGFEWLWRALQDPRKYRRFAVLPKFFITLLKKGLNGC